MNLGLETGPEAQALIAALQTFLPDRLWTERGFARGSLIFAQGDPAEDICILRSGLVKLTYTTADGQEWIKSIVADIGVFAGSDGDKGTAYSAECVEPCAVVRLPRAAVADVLVESPAMQALHAAFLGWMARRKQAREAALLCASAEERYRSLLTSSPAILARLPQGDIARYLGVTPVAFSRIKRRIAAGGPRLPGGPGDPPPAA
jgi:CRP-like cAMP-binding protein